MPTHQAKRQAPHAIRAVMLHKPAGCISTRPRPDAPTRPSVYDHLPQGWDHDGQRLGHCGRLDRDTTGLLLFTDDGLLSQALLNPGFTHEELPTPTLHIRKTYHLAIQGEVSDAQLEELQTPISIGTHRSRGAVITQPAQVKRIHNPDEPGTWLECILTDGKNRQIRRLCTRSQLELTTLRRVAFGPLTLGKLSCGSARILSQSEIDACYAHALPGLKPPQQVMLD